MHFHTRLPAEFENTLLSLLCARPWFLSIKNQKLLKDKNLKSPDIHVYAMLGFAKPCRLKQGRGEVMLRLPENALNIPYWAESPISLRSHL